MTPQNESAVVHETDFPFEEIRDEHGDYFTCLADAITAGFQGNQIWSVVESDDSHHCCVYGPPHHWVNLIGFVATKETHDNNTYYVEDWGELAKFVKE